MLSEVTVVAIVGASATVLVGISAALAQVFGPAWRDAKMRRVETELARETERFSKAEDMLKGIQTAATGQMGTVAVMLAARVSFFATLRAGEGAVARFVTAESNYVLTRRADFPEKLSEFADMLFGYLRGEIRRDELIGQTAMRNKPKGS